MYLKELEVENFKSFKGEAVIPFDRGFTAITGPNGSGKSNCGDAIQFVLGARSSKVLRAQNSKDLIFNGGKSNRPARNAKVTLVFANPTLSNGRRRLPIDYDEVKMTREVRLTKAKAKIFKMQAQIKCLGYLIKTHRSEESKYLKKATVDWLVSCNKMELNNQYLRINFSPLKKGLKMPHVIIHNTQLLTPTSNKQ